MFKLKIDLEKGLIQAAGSTIDVSADVLFIISEIHSAFKKSDELAAEAFRLAMVAGVTAQDSPCFSGQASPGTSFVINMGRRGGAE